MKVMKTYGATLFIVIGFSAYCLGRFVNIFADYDLWGYLSFGKLFWENGFPYHDVFSYVPTKAIWVYHEWLTGAIFFPLYKHFGGVGLQWLRYAVIIATLALLFMTAYRRGANSWSVGIVLFLAINGLTYGYAPVRAQIFTYLFFALSIYTLEHYKRERKPLLLWCLPLVQIVWCNTHGGFVAGLGLIGLYALGEGVSHRPFIPYLSLMLIAALATIVNPYGTDYWSYIIQAVSLPRPDITEWMSVPAAILNGRYREESFLFVSLLILTLFLAVRSRTRNLTDIAVLAVTAYLGLKSIRHMILFFLAFGALVPAWLTEYMDSLKSDPKIKPVLSRARKPASILICTFFVFLACLSLRHFIYGSSLDLRTPNYFYPVQALEWVKDQRWQGNIVPNFEWGEFIMWRCYPDCRVAMDGRLETVYGNDLQKEYFDFLHGRANWQTFLQKYPHDMVLIKRGSRTDTLMRNQTGWHLAYEDGLSVLFLHSKEVPAR